MGLQGGGSVGGKRNVKGERRKRCSALEPVLEHCELASGSMEDVDSSTTTTTTNPQQLDCAQNITQKGIPLRILAKLRDGYVKLMNEVAFSADLSGVSSFYGATGPGDHPACTLMLNSSRRPSAVA